MAHYYFLTSKYERVMTTSESLRSSMVPIFIDSDPSPTNSPIQIFFSTLLAAVRAITNQAAYRTATRQLLEYATRATTKLSGDCRLTSISSSKITRGCVTD